MNIRCSRFVRNFISKLFEQPLALATWLVRLFEGNYLLIFGNPSGIRKNDFLVGICKTGHLLHNTSFLNRIFILYLKSYFMSIYAILKFLACVNDISVISPLAILAISSIVSFSFNSFILVCIFPFIISLLI